MAGKLDLQIERSLIDLHRLNVSATNPDWSNGSVNSWRPWASMILRTYQRISPYIAIS